MSTTSKTYTISTRLIKSDALVEYFEPMFQKYAKILRIAFKDVQIYEMKELKKESGYQSRFDIDARTANSILRTANGLVKSHKELKRYELSQLNHKITALMIKIRKVSEIVNQEKEQARLNNLSTRQLEKYRQLKTNLYHWKQKYNRLVQKREQLKNYIRQGKFRIVFGTKKLFQKQNFLAENNIRTHQKWVNLFRKNRDKYATYIGAKDEPCGNQNFQMSYDEDKDTFNLKIRKDLEYMENPQDKYLCINDVKISYKKEKLIEILETKSSSLTYRVIRKGRKYYLQIMYTLKREESYYVTSEKQGTLGLDYNKGFIQLCETNKEGNIIGFEKIVLNHHGTGNRAKTEIEQKIHSIVKKALKKKKNIVIEDLNFGKKKSQVNKTSRDRKYNKQIHAFDYSRYVKTMENIGFRNKVIVEKINPYNTSIVGDRKYGKIKGINRHQAASYVIARKGQGFKDK